jgi:hypothetical protein
MLALAAEAAPFYTHNKWAGFLIVIGVCGAMVLWCCYVAYSNFGPPAKRKAQKADGG